MTGLGLEGVYRNRQIRWRASYWEHRVVGLWVRGERGVVTPCLHNDLTQIAGRVPVKDFDEKRNRLKPFWQ